MDDSTCELTPLQGESRPALRPESALPSLTNAERAFWRRAVEVERARQNCGRPAPFPFQDY
ncbi:MAG TPA: hypothetical protein VGA24_11380 [Steroidobacteraceae bacterium]